MPLLQVRDCPEDVYQKLRHRAESDNRSVHQETIVLLRSALELQDAGQYQSHLDRLCQRINDFNEQHPKTVLPSADWAAMIREDRER